MRMKKENYNVDKRTHTYTCAIHLDVFTDGFTPKTTRFVVTLQSVTSNWNRNPFGSSALEVASRDVPQRQREAFPKERQKRKWQKKTIMREDSQIWREKKTPCCWAKPLSFLACLKWRFPTSSINRAVQQWKHEHDRRFVLRGMH